MTPDQLRQICPRCKDPESVCDALNAAAEKWGVTDMPMFVAQLAHESGQFQWTAELASGAAYEGRRDLGNTEPGDGVRFKGRGYIQITGRDNYLRCGQALGLDLLTHPEQLQQLPHAADCAGWYWNWRHLNGLDMLACTRKINGGLNGLPSRRAFYEKAQAVLAPPVPETQAPAPVEDHSPTTEPAQEKPMAIPALVPIALEAISAIVPAVAGLLNDKTKTVSERNTAAAAKIVDVARDAIGAVNEQEMIERIQTDPAAAAQAKQAVQGAWFEIVEGGGGGVDGARKADSAMAATGDLLHSASFWITLALLPAVYLIVGNLIGLFGTAQWDPAARSALVGSLVGTIVGGIVGYYYGQTTSRNRGPVAGQGGAGSVAG